MFTTYDYFFIGIYMHVKTEKLAKTKSQRIKKKISFFIGIIVQYFFQWDYENFKFKT